MLLFHFFAELRAVYCGGYHSSSRERAGVTDTESGPGLLGLQYAPANLNTRFRVVIVEFVLRR